MGEKTTGEMESCPFCGGDDLDMTHDRASEYYRVICNDPACETEGPKDIDEESAVAAWNRRKDA